MRPSKMKRIDSNPQKRKISLPTYNNESYLDERENFLKVKESFSKAKLKVDVDKIYNRCVSLSIIKNLIKDHKRINMTKYMKVMDTSKSYFERLIEEGEDIEKKSGYINNITNDPASFAFEKEVFLHYYEVEDFFREPLQMRNERTGALITDTGDFEYSEQPCISGANCWCYKNFGFICRRFIQRYVCESVEKDSPNTFKHGGKNYIIFDVCLPCIRKVVVDEYNRNKLKDMIASKELLIPKDIPPKESMFPKIIPPHIYILKQDIKCQNHMCVVSKDFQDYIEENDGNLNGVVSQRFKKIVGIIKKKKLYPGYSVGYTIQQAENENYFGIRKAFTYHNKDNFVAEEVPKILIKNKNDIKKVHLRGIREIPSCFHSTRVSQLHNKQPKPQEGALLQFVDEFKKNTSMGTFNDTQNDATDNMSMDMNMSDGGNESAQNFIEYIFFSPDAALYLHQHGGGGWERRIRFNLQNFEQVKLNAETDFEDTDPPQHIVIEEIVAKKYKVKEKEKEESVESVMALQGVTSSTFWKWLPFNSEKVHVFFHSDVFWFYCRINLLMFWVSKLYYKKGAITLWRFFRQLLVHATPYVLEMERWYYDAARVRDIVSRYISDKPVIEPVFSLRSLHTPQTQTFDFVINENALSQKFSFGNLEQQINTMFSYMPSMDTVITPQPIILEFAQNEDPINVNLYANNPKKTIFEMYMQKINEGNPVMSYIMCLNKISKSELYPIFIGPDVRLPNHRFLSKYKIVYSLLSTLIYIENNWNNCELCSEYLLSVQKLIKFIFTVIDRRNVENWAIPSDIELQSNIKEYVNVYPSMANKKSLFELFLIKKDVVYDIFSSSYKMNKTLLFVKNAKEYFKSMYIQNLNMAGMLKSTPKKQNMLDFVINEEEKIWVIKNKVFKEKQFYEMVKKTIHHIIPFKASIRAFYKNILKFYDINEHYEEFINNLILCSTFGLYRKWCNGFVGESSQTPNWKQIKKIYNTFSVGAKQQRVKYLEKFFFKKKRHKKRLDVLEKTISTMEKLISKIKKSQYSLLKRSLEKLNEKTEALIEKYNVLKKIKKYDYMEIVVSEFLLYIFSKTPKLLNCLTFYSDDDDDYDDSKEFSINKKVVHKITKDLLINSIMRNANNLRINVLHRKLSKNFNDGFIKTTRIKKKISIPNCIIDNIKMLRIKYFIFKTVFKGKIPKEFVFEYTLEEMTEIFGREWVDKIERFWVLYNVDIIQNEFFDEWLIYLRRVFGIGDQDLGIYKNIMRSMYERKKEIDNLYLSLSRKAVSILFYLFDFVSRSSHFMSYDLCGDEYLQQYFSLEIQTIENRESEDLSDGNDVFFYINDNTTVEKKIKYTMIEKIVHNTFEMDCKNPKNDNVFLNEIEKINNSIKKKNIKIAKNGEKNITISFDYTDEDVDDTAEDVDDTAEDVDDTDEDVDDIDEDVEFEDKDAENIEDGSFDNSPMDSDDEDDKYKNEPIFVLFKRQERKNFGVNLASYEYFRKNSEGLIKKICKQEFFFGDYELFNFYMTKISVFLFGEIQTPDNDIMDMTQPEKQSIKFSDVLKVSQRPKSQTPPPKRQKKIKVKDMTLKNQRDSITSNIDCWNTFFRIIEKRTSFMRFVRKMCKWKTFIDKVLKKQFYTKKRIVCPYVRKNCFVEESSIIGKMYVKKRFNDLENSYKTFCLCTICCKPHIYHADRDGELYGEYIFSEDNIICKNCHRKYAVYENF